MRLLAICCLLLAACASTSAHTVDSPARPDLALRIDAAFTDLGEIAFPIEKMTDARRRVFVDADASKAIRRMIVLQFETAQSGSDFRFRFPARPPETFGAQTYRFNSFAYDDAAAARNDPSREAGQTRAMLAKKGYLPPDYFKAARLARVSDPDGMTEVIIFYLEAGGPGIESLPKDEDGDVILDAAEQARLLDALRKSITVIRG